VFFRSSSPPPGVTANRQVRVGEGRGRREVDLTFGPHMAVLRRRLVTLTRWRFNKSKCNLDLV
jgi:hypothetical protein